MKANETDSATSGRAWDLCAGPEGVKIMDERKDYRMLVKIKNNRILELIEASGFENVSQFCQHFGFQQGIVGQYVNMKKRPTDKRNGEWLPSILAIADALRCSPDSMFTESQKENILLKNNAEVTFEEKHLAQMTNFTPEQKLILDESRPEDLIETALMALNEDGTNVLTQSEKTVLQMRFGLHDSDEYTLQATGDELGVTPERIRQIEAKAMRKLRHPSRSEHMRDFLGFDQ